MGWVEKEGGRGFQVLFLGDGGADVWLFRCDCVCGVGERGLRKGLRFGLVWTG